MGTRHEASLSISDGKAGTADQIRSDAILRILRRLRHGSLELTLPDGSAHVIEAEAPGPRATLRVHDGRVVDRYLKHGSVGFAESYIAGEWETAHLPDLLELLDRNYDAWGDGYVGPILARAAARVQHWLRRNSKTGSRRNIHAHYDLGNEFFAAWLDPTMTYSAALFDPSPGTSPGTAETDLETAQRAKYHHLCRMVDLRPGHRLLEIGSGWGGFAIEAASRFGAEVTTITISQAQYEMARQRIAEAGLNERVEVRLEDYRDVAGEYDRVASIEMFEAVGEAYWPTFFGKLEASLKPGGMAGLQIITIADRYFESYRRSADFIQQYIFPGGMLPSDKALERETRQAGLEITERFAFGRHYAKTLGLWRERFDEVFDQLRGHGFDDRFRRLWRYYLGYCEAGFRTGSTDVVQLALRRA